MEERAWLITTRKTAGLRQKDVAKKAGISQSYYAQLESGARGKNISGRIAKKVAKVLGFKWTSFYR
ncbi:MAG: helix-turn-helix transcriptional regulator [Oscillospiraceae bacterium]|jgi:transcriptional regulator with XRE-family HTH domain|nr:helix-turn-helix transcriptional regulator [Oscillospiraceae bacterium]